MSNDQFEYYIKNKIHAVDYIPSQLTSHFEHRRNLLENHLGIPLLSFKERSVIEFGPCSAENALFLAYCGAKLTLVEPDLRLHYNIRQLFSLHATKTSTITKPEIIGKFVEDFDSVTKFDFVIAEGFLHALSNRYDVLESLFELSEGFVIITYLCGHGIFFEAIKRYIFRRVLCSANITENNLFGQLEIAKNFFYNDFKGLKSARTFESWVLDVLVNPCLAPSMLDHFDGYVSIAESYGFRVHGMSPKWDLRNHHKWYKNCSTKSIVDEWKNNLSFIILGTEEVQLDPKELELIRRLNDHLIDYTEAPDSDLPIEINKLAQGLSSYFDDIKLLFEFLANHDFDVNKLNNIYLNAPNCRNWGMPNHYLALQRSSSVFNDIHEDAPEKQ